MKRWFSLVPALALCCALLAGCTNTTDTPDGANGGVIDPSGSTVVDDAARAGEDLVDRGENAMRDAADDMDPNRTTDSGATAPSDGGTAANDAMNR